MPERLCLCPLPPVQPGRPENVPAPGPAVTRELVCSIRSHPGFDPVTGIETPVAGAPEFVRLMALLISQSDDNPFGVPQYYGENVSMIKIILLHGAKQL